MNRATIKHDNQQLFQELFDRLKEDGISAFLPQNLSDQHINFLMQSMSSLLDCDINYFQIIMAACGFESHMVLKICPKNENQRPIMSLSLV